HDAEADVGPGEVDGGDLPDAGSREALEEPGELCLECVEHALGGPERTHRAGAGKETTSAADAPLERGRVIVIRYDVFAGAGDIGGANLHRLAQRAKQGD